MNHKRELEEGVSYVVTPDPTVKDPVLWSIIVEGGPYDKVVGKYSNIEIRESGKSITYDFTVLYMPPDFDEEGHAQSEYDDLVKRILIDWIGFCHKSGSMIYEPIK